MYLHVQKYINQYQQIEGGYLMFWIVCMYIMYFKIDTEKDQLYSFLDNTVNNKL